MPAEDRNLYLLDVNLDGQDYLAGTIPIHGSTTASEIIVVN